MSLNWTLNMAGLPIGEERRGTISRPHGELVIHVATKTVQAGGLLGTVLIGPIVAAAKGHRDLEGFKHYAQKCGTYGLGIGLVAGPLMTYQVLKANKASYDSVVDRCYRLRHNRGQLRVDRLSAVGALAGYGAATYLGEQGTLGALLGMSGGIIFAAVLNNMF